MKLGIMQPYFFPYLGYWQLINTVDKFVLLDDVNFIMRGYINRNYILLNGQSKLFTIPLEKPSQNKLINETSLKFSEKDKKNFLKTIQFAYQKAPFYNIFMPILTQIINTPQQDLTSFIEYAFILTNEYLQISTEIIKSSEIKKNNELKSQERIIEINKILKANTYINAIGGQKLYSKEEFTKQGINLNFIKMKDFSYKQFNNEFVANLSMIDVLMFNSVNEIRNMLNNYELIS